MATIPFQPTSGEFPGLDLTVLTGNTTSGVTPRTTTFQLPSKGVWLAVITGKVNGSDTAQSAATYVLVWTTNTTNLLQAQNLSQVGMGGAFAVGSNGSQLSAPDATGLVTATGNWGAGGSNFVSFTLSLRKLVSLT